MRGTRAVPRAGDLPCARGTRVANQRGAADRRASRLPGWVPPGTLRAAESEIRQSLAGAGCWAATSARRAHRVGAQRAHRLPMAGTPRAICPPGCEARVRRGAACTRHIREVEGACIGAELMGSEAWPEARKANGESSGARAANARRGSRRGRRRQGGPLRAEPSAARGAPRCPPAGLDIPRHPPRFGWQAGGGLRDGLIGGDAHALRDGLIGGDAHALTQTMPGGEGRAARRAHQGMPRTVRAPVPGPPPQPRGRRCSGRRRGAKSASAASPSTACPAASTSGCSASFQPRRPVASERTSR